MGIDRTHEIPGSETKGFIIHCKISSKSISIVAQFHSPQVAFSHKEATERPGRAFLLSGCTTERGFGIRASPALTASREQACAATRGTAPASIGPQGAFLTLRLPTAQKQFPRSSTAAFSWSESLVRTL